MQYTSNYHLNLPEGTDVVNPLVQDNPNYSAIDVAMFANKQAVIGSATEVVSGTAHAITRANTDSNYFRFTATGNWVAGDTMTVDGTTVNVYLSDGTTLDSGAYVINSEVLAILNGTRVTLIVSGKTQVIGASSVTYNNATSGLTATNAQTAIDELAGLKEVLTVSSDNVRTWADALALINAAFTALSDVDKYNSVIVLGSYVCWPGNISAGRFACTQDTGTYLDTYSVNLTDGSYFRHRTSHTGVYSFTDNSTNTQNAAISLYIKK